MPWNFAVVGRGRDRDWWTRFVRKLLEVGRVNSLSIEHEDPNVSAEEGVPAAAAILLEAVRASAD
jgi:sugar phosphate isomerase/epimerase